jgi:alpha-amylase
VVLRAEVAAPWGRLLFEKTVSLEPGARAVEVRWTIRPAPGSPPDTFRFATELTLTLPEHPGSPRGFAFDEPGAGPDVPTALESRGMVEGIRRMRLLAEHHGFDVALAPSPAADLWHKPLETVSQSEEGFEAVFQGANLLFVWPATEASQEHPATFAVRLIAQVR